MPLSSQSSVPAPVRIKVVLPLIVFLLFQMTLLSPVAAENSGCTIALSPWTTAAPVPFPHLEGPGAVIDSKMYVFGGFMNSNLEVSTRTDVYNMATNIWETVATPLRPMPVGISHTPTAVDGQYIWLVGGFVGNNPGKATNQVWKYDTVTDLWYTGPPLPAKRASGVLSIVGQAMHYFGGDSTDKETMFPDHWILNLDNTNAGWQTSSPMPSARMHLSWAVLGPEIYAIGGQYNHEHNPIDLDLVHTYNTATGEWTQKASLPFPRSHFEHGMSLIDGKIIAIGGRANQSGPGNGQTMNVTQYDPTTNQWTDLRPMPVKMLSVQSGVYNNQLYVTAGRVNWNTANLNTYVSTISLNNCNAAQPTSAPTTVEPASTATYTRTPEPTDTPTTLPTNQPTQVPSDTPTELPSVTPSEQATEAPSNTPSSTPSQTFTNQPTAAFTDVATTTATPVYTIFALKLINANTDKGIATLRENYIINCASIGTSNLNIRAITIPDVVGSVMFGLDEVSNYITENGAPYAIGSNIGTDYLPWTPANGQHTLTVTPYTLKDRGGTAGIATVIHFSVQNCTASTIGSRVSAHLLNPQDQAVISPDQVVFTWSPVAGAATYRLTIKRTDKKKTVASIVLNSADVCDNQICTLDTSLLELKFKPEHSYRWRIIARTADGNIKSDRQTFSVQTNLLPLP